MNLVLILLCLRFGFNHGLHEFMTDAELGQYFQTDSLEAIPQYEVVNLPVVLEASSLDEEISYNFEAFSRPVKLRLKRNSHILSPVLKSYVHDDDGVRLLGHLPRNCHFLHRDETTSASMSLCQPNSIQALVFLNDTIIEVQPLNERLRALLKTREPLLEDLLNEELTIPHLVKRAKLTEHFDREIFPTSDIKLEVLKRASHRPVGALTLELALFFDEAAYKLFAPYMKYNDRDLQDMLLAYMNGVQALYHHPSLGGTLEIVLVRLDIMKRQPNNLPHYDGERSKLLDSFCYYQNSLNPTGDSNPLHWDMAVYVSGLDFFAYERGRKSGVTMGLATVGGVCMGKYACVIAEFGTVNVFGKPYPSAGFTSVYIMAHEIGHNLGMHHDSVGNSCSKEGYIMSPSRGTNGETTWSYCSADVMSKLSWAKCLKDSAKSNKQMDHSIFYDSPGQTFTAKRQCEILLRDRDAIVSPNQELSTICYNLQCKTPHRSGYYFAGPALDGTQCGPKKYCFGGECGYKSPRKPVTMIAGGWSEWKQGACSSGCIKNSKGAQMKRRFCNNPTPVNTEEGCEGSSIEFALCKDDNICKERKEITQFAGEKCREFSKLLPELDPNGGGLQAPHEEARVWMGCAIFCKRADSGSFYTPRIELNDLGVSPYFPDGTWCHKSNNMNYYCVHHHCLPENFQFTKSGSILHGIGDDVPISQNANPNGVIPPAIKTYLSLGPDGKPMQKVLKPSDSDSPKEEDWETKDYIDVPEITHKLRMEENEIED